MIREVEETSRRIEDCGQIIGVVYTCTGEWMRVVERMTSHGVEWVLHVDIRVIE